VVPDPDRLQAVGPDLRVVDPSVVLWRIHRTTGPHVTAWNELRRFGPIAWCRFDPHPAGPARLHPDAGVLYLAGDPATALAEAYQLTRVVDLVTGRPAVTAFRPGRALTLVDLTGSWPLRVGASHVINTDDRRVVTQAWARAIAAAWPDLDGLWHTSSLTGSPCVTLFAPGSTALPGDPVRTWLLDDPAVADVLAVASRRIGYRIA
jgi:hypothetical protein